MTVNDKQKRKEQLVREIVKELLTKPPKKSRDHDD